VDIIQSLTSMEEIKTKVLEIFFSFSEKRKDPWLPNCRNT